MAEPDEEKRAFRLGWSAWRRAHQAVAKRCKKASRGAKRALRRESTLEDRIGPHATTLSPEEAPLTDAESLCTKITSDYKKRWFFRTELPLIVYDPNFWCKAGKSIDNEQRNLSLNGQEGDPNTWLGR